MKILRSSFIAAALFALATSFAAAVVPPPLPAPIATFDVGSLHVAQYGSGPRSLIFIPGLTCGPWEWSGQIDHFGSQYTIYALTLPGFDGQPPISGPLFDTVSADFWRLLDQRHIVKPVVIGHSLGGTMGFVLATQHPELLAGVVALDGLPIYPSSAFMTRAQIQSEVATLQSHLATETQAQFQSAEQTQILPYLITSPSDVAAVAPLTARSNPVATGKWFAEDMLLDLRPALPKANVPILLLAPFDATLDSKVGLATPDAKRAFYARLVQGAPNIQVVMIDNSRHFAMYDQPQAVTDDITQFLSKVEAP